MTIRHSGQAWCSFSPKIAPLNPPPTITTVVKKAVLF
jgi:hypothetical protein